MFDLITLADGYKLCHKPQYPQGTTSVYSNWTARSSRVEGQKEVVFITLQYFLQRYMGEMAHETFFGVRKEVVVKKYLKKLERYLGPANNIGAQHIADLHDLGYIPLEFRALPEGTRVPLRVPMFTVENTHPDFFWVTNYFETLMSNVIWKGCTSATNAYRMRKMFDAYAIKTGGDPAFVDWQGHDFSFRGMSGPEDAGLSGLGHLLSFTGTDTFGPAFDIIDQYYYGEQSALVGGSVPATEHSVMCAGGAENEKDTYSRIISMYPEGIVSIVSDTWDLWHVVGNILPQLKDQIMARNGKTVIRPDSGNPADILCGDPSIRVTDKRSSLVERGLIEALWDLFGGTINEKGYKVLDSHIGTIYGDSITFERAQEIFQRLEAKGFASTNVVLGMGSYFYEYQTRDTYGFAMKATAATINGVEHAIFKDPKTDDGAKKSAKGRITVFNDAGTLTAADGLTLEQQEQNACLDHLQLVWRNGVFYKRWSLDDLRANIRSVRRGFKIFNRTHTLI
jgi:nicotinamide phosphoribosyltransferase